MHKALQMRQERMRADPRCPTSGCSRASPTSVIMVRALNIHSACEARLALFFDGTRNQESTQDKVPACLSWSLPMEKTAAHSYEGCWKGVGTTPWDGIRGGAFGWGYVERHSARLSLAGGELQRER